MIQIRGCYGCAANRVQTGAQHSCPKFHVLDPKGGPRGRQFVSTSSGVGNSHHKAGQSPLKFALGGDALGRLWIVKP
jgi:hypothetical protein